MFFWHLQVLYKNEDLRYLSKQRSLILALEQGFL